MTGYIALFMLSALFFGSWIDGWKTSAAAQGQLATLVPPTLFPTNIPPTAPPPMIDSALKRIRADKNKPRLTIGILYNAKPFASLNETGEVIGFEADIGRALAEDWGIPTNPGTPPIFQQVTRQNGVAMLLSGQIDLLMGQVIHTRAMEQTLDFSEPIFVNHQVALTMNDNPAKDIAELGGQTVGVVIDSPAEQALAEWEKVTGVQLTVKRLALFDDGIKALDAHQIAAFVDDRWNLDAQVGGGKIANIKLLNGSFRDEPYAIAMRPHDNSLRTLVNRTLQRLAKREQFGPLFDRWFPQSILPADQRPIPVPWNGLDDDKRTIWDDNFPVDILLPTQPVQKQMETQKVIRVAGLGNPDASGKYSLLDTFDQALVTEMARRWGVTTQFMLGTSANAEDLVASGTADLAVGLEPHWGTVERVDFAGIYAIHGYRLLVAVGRNISNFKDLLATNRNLGIFTDDPSAFQKALDIAKTVNVIRLNKKDLSSEADIIPLIASGDMSVVFGDSLRLIPYAAANPNVVKLLDKEYTRQPLAFAVPRNDSDFRALVETTLQDMARDGTYQKIWKEQFGVGDPLTILYWP